MISQRAIDLIVREEVSSKEVYNKRYQSPEWPGGASGITIGIGYDVGAGVSSASQLNADWAGRIPGHMIDRLARGIRVTGLAAKNLLPMNDVVVPWDTAMAVFTEVTLPKYYAMTARALPNFEMLSEDCKGALVSLVYNRGASFSIPHDPVKDPSDRYREMRAIKQHMINKEFDRIPNEFRNMARLWPTMAGLQKRRVTEAKLFERGLKAPLGTGGATVVATVIVSSGATVANEISKPAPDYSWLVGVGMITIIAVVALIVIIKKLKK